MNCNIGANVNVREKVCSLTVILLVVIVNSNFSGVSLLAVLKDKVMWWQGVLNWLPI